MENVLILIEDGRKLYIALAPLALALVAFLWVALPILGRFIAPWAPTLAEQLIRLAGDIKGAAEARKLPAGTASVSALPLAEVSPPSTTKRPPGTGNGAASSLSVITFAILFGVATGVTACGPGQHPCVGAYDRARTEAEIAEVDKVCGHLLDVAGGDAGSSSASSSAGAAQ